MSMSRLAVVGAKDTIMGFRALGLTLFPVTNAQETMAALKQAFAEDYGAVFVTERFAPKTADLPEEMRLKPWPVIVVIPDGQANLGIGLRKMKETVEKAIGVDILFKGDAEQ